MKNKIEEINVNIEPNYSQSIKSILNYKKDMKIILSDAAHVKEKEIVLIVGNTGSGKSSLSNYLCGLKLQRKKALDKVTNIYDVSEEEKRSGKNFSMIGHVPQSCTVYPKILSPETEGMENIVYCDCPGFDDTRLGNQRVIGSIGIQLAVQHSCGVKAVLVVINYSSFSTDRAVGVRNLATTLASIIPNFKDRLSGRVDPNDKIFESFIFIITHKEKLTTESFFSVLDSLISVDEREMHELREQCAKKTGVSEDDEKKADLIEERLLFYKIMKKKHGSLFISNLNSDEKREDLIKRIKEAKRVSSDFFIFNKYDERRVKFDQQLQSVYHLAIRLFNEAVRKKERFDDFDLMIKKNKNGDELFEQALNELKKMEPAEDEERRSPLEVSRGLVKLLIEKLSEDRAEILYEITLEEGVRAEIQNELNKVDQNTLEVVYEDIFRRSTIKVFGYRHTFEYISQQKVPIVTEEDRQIEVIEEGGGTITRDAECSLSEGIYRARYQSNRPAYSCHAKVTLYSRMKDIHKEFIDASNECLDAHRINLENKKKSLLEIDERISSISENLMSFVESEASQDRDKLKKVIAELKEKFFGEKYKIEKKLNKARIEFYSAKEEVEKLKDPFILVKEISTHINPSDPFFGLFLKSFNDYIKVCSDVELVKLTKNIGTAYKVDYIAYEIELLLTYYLCKNRQVCRLEPIMVNGNNENYRELKDNFEKYHARRKFNPEHSLFVKNKIFAPISLVDGHWVLVFVVYGKTEDRVCNTESEAIPDKNYDINIAANKSNGVVQSSSDSSESLQSPIYSSSNEELPKVYYFDPNGEEIPQELKKVIVSADGFSECKIVSINQSTLCSQDSCGFWVVQVARHIAESEKVEIPEINNIQRFQYEHYLIVNPLQKKTIEPIFGDIAEMEMLKKEVGHVKQEIKNCEGKEKYKKMDLGGSLHMDKAEDLQSLPSAGGGFNRIRRGARIDTYYSYLRIKKEFPFELSKVGFNSRRQYTFELCLFPLIQKEFGQVPELSDARKKELDTNIRRIAFAENRGITEIEGFITKIILENKKVANELLQILSGILSSLEDKDSYAFSKQMGQLS